MLKEKIVGNYGIYEFSKPKDDGSEYMRRKIQKDRSKTKKAFLSFLQYAQPIVFFEYEGVIHKAIAELDNDYSDIDIEINFFGYNNSESFAAIKKIKFRDIITKKTFTLDIYDIKEVWISSELITEIESKAYERKISI